MLTSGVEYGLTRRGGHRRQKPCCCLRTWKQVPGRAARPGIQHVAHVAEDRRVPGGISHRADVAAVQEQAAHEGGLAAGRSLLRQRCLRPRVMYLWIVVCLAHTQTNVAVADLVVVLQAAESWSAHRAVRISAAARIALHRCQSIKHVLKVIPAVQHLDEKAVKGVGAQPRHQRAGLDQQVVA